MKAHFGQKVQFASQWTGGKDSFGIFNCSKNSMEHLQENPQVV